MNLKDFKPSDIVEGVSARVLLKHLPLIFIGVFFAMGYISVRFDCTTAMETISHLKTRLEVVKTETQRERANYMSATCESAMKRTVDNLGLGLQIQERPPYRVESEE